MKFLKGLLRFIGVVLILLVLFIMTMKAAGFVILRDFYKNATKEFKIPGITEKYVPQGLTYDEGSETYITSGYVKDGHSVIYTISVDGKEKKLNMLDKDGNACNDHFGGCAVYKDYLLICGGDGSSNGRQFLYTYSLSDILAAEKNASIRALAETDVATGAAFVYVVDNTCYVGEFNHNGSELYELKNESRFVKVSDTVTNKAIMLSYTLDQNGIIAETPDKAYSIPDDTQGVCFDKNGNFFFSHSWGTQPSYMTKYAPVTESTGTITVNGAGIPLYVFNDQPVKKYKTSPMLEEIVYVNGRIYCMNESASCKYIFGNLFRGRHVYSIAV